MQKSVCPTYLIEFHVLSLEDDAVGALANLVDQLESGSTSLLLALEQLSELFGLAVFPCVDFGHVSLGDLISNGSSISSGGNARCHLTRLQRLELLLQGSHWLIDGGHVVAYGVSGPSLTEYLLVVTE